jgi:hypothetical protein
MGRKIRHILYCIRKLFLIPFEKFIYVLAACLPVDVEAWGQGFQRDVVYLGWPIAPSYMSPNVGGGGELRGISRWVQLCTWSPNKFLRSNSIFNLCLGRFLVMFSRARQLRLQLAMLLAAACWQCCCSLPADDALDTIVLWAHIVTGWWGNFLSVNIKINFYSIYKHIDRLSQR